MPRKPSTSHFLAAAVMCASLPLQVAAQSASGRPLPSRGWTGQPTVAVDEEFDGNVFLLSDARKTKLDGSAAAGTHYADMVSASDAITTLRMEFAAAGPGIRGKRVRITPELEYVHYARNTERTGFRYGVRADQKMGNGGLLRLKLAMQPHTFFKNYLVDAVDRDLSGSITTDERLYAPARQGETALDGDYTLRLRKPSHHRILGASLRLAGGWYSRSYGSAFAARDLKGPSAGTTLLLHTSSGVRLDLGYALAALAAPRMRTVMLLDETQFDRDFNGNGTITDVAARAEEMVDRSRSEQEFSAAFGSDLGRADVELEYARRARSFGSKEPYDVGNNGRRDARTTVGASLRYDLADAVRVRLTTRRGAQTLNRVDAGAGTGDVADYTRVRTSLGLEYRF
ncbi:MAG TPA: hypothetical protein VG432_03565 [Gemmatimonadaceae bacterium]|nr:hypothetical protein [Gemmatimonadaceae bacterium]